MRPVTADERPVFIGGTGRSGTTVLGVMLGRNPRYHTLRAEAHFHCDEGGLRDLLVGQTTYDDFVDRVRTHWFRRPSVQGTERGLCRWLSQEELDSALAAFESGFP